MNFKLTPSIGDVKQANECAKFIIQSGIREVIYVKDNDANSDSSRASRILFEVSGVKVTKMKPSVPSIKINFGTNVGQSKHAELGSADGTQNEDEMEKYLGLMQREAAIDPFKFTVKKRADYLSWDEYFST